MRTAITGTPGAGKTTLAALLEAQGERVLQLATWARRHGAVNGRDEADDADVIDMDILERAPLPPDCFVDGHLAHLLPVDEVWLLRCDPAVLRPRLEARGYSPSKVQENWEAEAMDLLLQEALATGARVVQRDATRRSAEELLAEFRRVAAARGHDLEPVDWSQRLLD